MVEKRVKISWAALDFQNSVKGNINHKGPSLW